MANRVIAAERRKAIAAVVEKLPAEDRDRSSFKEIADAFGVTAEMVRKVAIDAKLINPTKAKDARKFFQDLRKAIAADPSNTEALIAKAVKDKGYGEGYVRKQVRDVLPSVSKSDIQRAFNIVAAYSSGDSMATVGAKFGVTKQAVLDTVKKARKAGLVK